MARFSDIFHKIWLDCVYTYQPFKNSNYNFQEEKEGDINLNSARKPCFL